MRVVPASSIPRGLGPLADDFEAVLDEVLRGRGTGPIADVAKMGPTVAEVSRVYNAGLAGSLHRAPLDGRIAFSFARDVPKGAAAVRELVQAGLIDPSETRPLRVLDLGAGLGAITWGIARAVFPRPVEALLVDDDDEVLAAASGIARTAAKLGAGEAKLSIETRRASLGLGMKGMSEPADVVVLGQVLSELDGDRPADARVTAHAALAMDLLDRLVAENGALVIIEPALRERSRHLHAVRDLLAAKGRTVFAPCLHAEPCPMLTAGPTEWCHDDLPVDLPPWLVPLARAAGLRFQGLTFAHLVLRRDRQTLREASSTPSGSGSTAKLHLRVVSDQLVSKGKVEIFGCTSAGVRERLRRLDRDAPPRNESDPWTSLVRGDVVTVDVPPNDDEALAAFAKRRIPSAAAVDVWRGRR